MEISNPIASQYVSNQGLAAQLNSQNAPLPIKSERFSVNSKNPNQVPAPTEDEQRLRSEENKPKPANAQQLILSESSAAANTYNDLASFQQSSNQQANQNPLPSLAQNKQLSGPIQSYMETSAMTGKAPDSSRRVDIFI